MVGRAIMISAIARGIGSFVSRSFARSHSSARQSWEASSNLYWVLLWLSWHQLLCNTIIMGLFLKENNKQTNKGQNNFDKLDYWFLGYFLIHRLKLACQSRPYGFSLVNKTSRWGWIKCVRADLLLGVLSRSYHPDTPLLSKKNLIACWTTANECIVQSCGVIFLRWIPIKNIYEQNEVKLKGLGILISQY